MVGAVAHLNRASARWRLRQRPSFAPFLGPMSTVAILGLFTHVRMHVQVVEPWLVISGSPFLIERKHRKIARDLYDGRPPTTPRTEL